MTTPRGTRTHKVRIEAPGPIVTDGFGGQVESWMPLDPPDWWVSIENTSDRNQEHPVANTRIATATHVLRGDYRPDITSVCRCWVPDLDKDGVTHRYDIVSVIAQDAARRELIIVASEYISDHDPRPKTFQTAQDALAAMGVPVIVMES